MSTEFAKFNDFEDWSFLLCALGCVTCAALAAGLTLGILSLDILKLQIKAECGNDGEKSAAGKILPLLRDRHLLLCTLLVFNSLANEALPIFLDSLVPSYAAVLISVSLVLICGEVLPAAFFTGPNQLAIASRFIPLVTLLICVFYPLAKPMAMGLDWLLGHDEGELLNRDELSVLMHITRQSSIAQYEHQLKSGEGVDTEDLSNMISQDEVKTITGVLGLAKKSIRDVMIPMQRVDMLSSDESLSLEVLQRIDKMGHSRLPVYRGKDKSRILGYLFVKKLILVNPQEKVALKDMQLKCPLIVGANQPLNELLNMFQTGRSHIAIVTEDPKKFVSCMESDTAPPVSALPLGIVTIEDIFEEILQEEIYDESDVDKPKGDIPRELLLTLMRTPSLAPSFARTLSTNPSFARSKSMGPSAAASASSSPAPKQANFMSATLLTKFARPNQTSSPSTSSAAPRAPLSLTASAVSMTSDEFAVTSQQALLPAGGETRSVLHGLRSSNKRYVTLNNDLSADSNL